jgi:hypothetical protein
MAASFLFPVFSTQPAVHQLLPFSAATHQVAHTITLDDWCSFHFWRFRSSTAAGEKEQTVP